MPILAVTIIIASAVLGWAIWKYHLRKEEIAEMKYGKAGDVEVSRFDDTTNVTDIG